jgi:hypothetical protein
MPTGESIHRSDYSEMVICDYSEKTWGKKSGIVGGISLGQGIAHQVRQALESQFSQKIEILGLRFPSGVYGGLKVGPRPHFSKPEFFLRTLAAFWPHSHIIIKLSPFPRKMTS